MINIWKKILGLVKIINPTAKVIGLEMGNTILRLVILGGDRKLLKEESIKLGKGVIESGKIKDRTKLSEALTKLVKQSSLRRPVSVIVSISASNVYLQVFHLPPVARARLEESARLNLQMISPINTKSAYYDWELLDEKSGSPADLLGAFAVALEIDELTDVLEGAGFNVAAIESAPMSLARALGGMLPDLSSPHICLRLSGDGLDFFILKNGRLYFSYFVSWSSLKEGDKADIDLGKVKEEISKELRRLSSFYVSKWGETVGDLVLIGVAENKQLASYIKENFSFNIHNFSVNSAWGAALRGLMSRSEDHLISLAKADTEEKFLQVRALHFIRFWRNILVTAAGVLVVVYVAFDGAVFWSSSNISKELAEAPPSAGLDNQSIADLEIKAKDFNSLVTKALAAKEQSIAWSLFFRKILNLTGQSVEITQAQIDQTTMLVTIGGKAKSEKEVLEFKTTLSKEEDFTDVNLPLTAIKTDIDGKANFSVTFKVGSEFFKK